MDAQKKLNTGKDVDILFKDNNISLNDLFKGKDPYLFELVNNTDNTYIIDPDGFKEDNFVSDCKNNILFPEKIILKGFYRRFDDDQCIEDFIILNPREKKIVSLNIISLKG